MQVNLATCFCLWKVTIMLTNFIRVLKSICWQYVNIVRGVCGGQVVHIVEVINHYPGSSSVWYVNTYPLERDLWGGWFYPALEKGVFLIFLNIKFVSSEQLLDRGWTKYRASGDQIISLLRQRLRQLFLETMTNNNDKRQYKTRQHTAYTSHTCVLCTFQG